jgi:hypothetical protein
VAIKLHQYETALFQFPVIPRLKYVSFSASRYEAGPGQYFYFSVSLAALFNGTSVRKPLSPAGYEQLVLTSSNLRIHN